MAAEGVLESEVAQQVAKIEVEVGLLPGQMQDRICDDRELKAAGRIHGTLPVWAFQSGISPNGRRRISIHCL